MVIHSFDNDIQLSSKILEWSIEYLGEKNVLELDARMTSEDFSYLANELPSCFYRLGVRNEEKGIVSNLHTSTFDVDDNVFKLEWDSWHGSPSNG